MESKSNDGNAKRLIHVFSSYQQMHQKASTDGNLSLREISSEVTPATHPFIDIITVIGSRDEDHLSLSKLIRRRVRSRLRKYSSKLVVFEGKRTRSSVASGATSLLHPIDIVDEESSKLRDKSTSNKKEEEVLPLSESLGSHDTEDDIDNYRDDEDE
ncbi:hypothetical protein HAX54_050124 [Datura stramonium]|uniref:Uncharacterized protein n=1 Tax=Datura stramonium TaxID=4076 RepID=A0ABS8WPY3_DATST|nr:hypothetical protein [Datura stramonium]